MKHNNKYVNLKPLLMGTFFVFVTFTTCRKSEGNGVYPRRDEIPITLALKLPSSPKGLKTYTITEADEDELREVDVLVFMEDIGGEERFVYSAAGVINTGDGGVQLTAKLRLDENTANKYRLVVLANVRQQLNAYGINIGETKEYVQNHLEYTVSGKWNATSSLDFTPLPMWGETDNLIAGMNSSAIEDAMEGGEIKMLRSLARVDVKNLVSSIFTLTEIVVYNSNTKGFIIPNPAYLDGAGVNQKAIDVSLPLPTVPNPPLIYTSISGNALIGGIYLSEAAAASDIITPDPQATALVVGGYFTTDPSKEQRYYRIDFKNGDDEFIPLLRNHHYTIDIVGADINGRNFPDHTAAFAAVSVPISYGGGSHGIRPGNPERSLDPHPSVRYGNIDLQGTSGITYSITTIDENQ